MRKHLVGVGFLFVVACGGEDSVGVDELGDAIIDANCAFLVECEGMPDRATCDTAVAIGGDFETLLAAVERGTVEYDGEAAKACIDAIGGQGCTFDGFHTADPCDDVFTGTVAPGGACFVDLECAGTGECNQTDPACDPEIACCPGICAAGPSESAAGGPCDDELHYCALGTYCKSDTTGTSTCTAVLTSEGAPCDEIDACANPMYCNLSFSTGTGTCRTAPRTNEACVSADLLPCADNRDYCDSTTSTCVRSAAVGESCAAGITCVDYAECFEGLCVAGVGAGAACSPDAPPACLGSLDCVSGVCTLPPPELVCQ